MFISIGIDENGRPYINTSGGTGENWKNKASTPTWAAYATTLYGLSTIPLRPATWHKASMA